MKFEFSVESRVKTACPTAALCNEGGWYWVLLDKNDSAPGSLRNPKDAWIDAERRLNARRASTGGA